AVEHRALLGRRPEERHLHERSDRHQAPPLALAAARARFALAIFEVTTAARSTSERKIWMRAMSRLAFGISTFSNRFTRCETRRTAPFMRFTRSRYTCRRRR